MGVILLHFIDEGNEARKMHSLTAPGSPATLHTLLSIPQAHSTCRAVGRNGLSLCRIHFGISVHFSKQKDFLNAASIGLWV
jgi:hypothetical protein